jgi:hypothetical protein
MSDEVKSKHQQWVDDIRSAEGAVGGIKLSQWEEEFVESIEDRLGKMLSLTPDQSAKLEEIWDRI